MRGIPEKRLKEMAKGCPDGEKRHTLLRCVDECKELNPWQPISTAPLDRKIRLFKKYTKTQVEDTLALEEFRQYFSHWQELPQDPK